jgi:hypothetical protein
MARTAILGAVVMESSGGVRSLANRSLRPMGVDMSNKDTGIHNIGITPDLRRALCRLGLVRWQDGGLATGCYFTNSKSCAILVYPSKSKNVGAAFGFANPPNS